MQQQPSSPNYREIGWDIISESATLESLLQPTPRADSAHGTSTTAVFGPPNELSLPSGGLRESLDAHAPEQQTSLLESLAGFAPQIPSNIRLVFPEETRLPKCRRPHYSQKLNTMFVKAEQDCSFTIAADIEFPHTTCIKVSAVYAAQEDRRHQVKRCIVHKDPEGTNISTGFSHFLMSCNSQPLYNEEADGSLSIYLAFSSAVKTDFGQAFTFQFTCLQSCFTPLKLRPMKLVFTVMSERGDVLKELSVGLKVCSTPSRDIGKAEGKEEKVEEMPRKPKIRRSNDTKEDFSVSSINVMGQATKERVEDIAFQLELAEFVQKRYPHVVEEFHQIKSSAMGDSQNEDDIDAPPTSDANLHS